MSDVFSALRARLAQRGRQYQEASGRACLRGGEFLATRVRDNVPVQSGTLQKTVRVVEEQRTLQRTSVLVEVGSAEAPYALKVEMRSPDEDRAHVNEATPEGYPGSGFLRRVITFPPDLDAVRGIFADELASVR